MVVKEEDVSLVKMLIALNLITILFCFIYIKGAYLKHHHQGSNTLKRSQIGIRQYNIISLI